MKRILLIGEFNKSMDNLNESLISYFQVQVCPMEVDNVQNLIKIAKPDCIIVCVTDAFEKEQEILSVIANKRIKLPVLMIGKKVDCERYWATYHAPQFDMMFRPIMKNALLDKCNTLLRIQDKEETEVSTEEKPQKHILVVDDNALVLRNVKDMLEPDYKVSVANSGEQALKFIPIKNPDLILLDYEMPYMDGKKTFQKIRQDCTGQEIPVIFLTGVADKEHILDVLQLEPAGYLLKPPALDKLLNAIENVFHKKED